MVPTALGADGRDTTVLGQCHPPGGLPYSIFGGREGISLHSSTRSTISDNTVTGARDGLRVVGGSSENHFATNRVTGGLTAIFVDADAAQNEFTANQLERNVNGVYVVAGAGEGNRFIANTISGSAEIGIRDDGAPGDTQYEGNTCSEVAPPSQPAGLCDP